MYQESEIVKADYKNYKQPATASSESTADDRTGHTGGKLQLQNLPSSWNPHHIVGHHPRAMAFSRTMTTWDLRNSAHLAYRELNAASIETVKILPIAAQYPELTLESTQASNTDPEDVKGTDPLSELPSRANMIFQTQTPF